MNMHIQRAVHGARTALWISVLAFPGAPALAQTQLYNITDLGSLGGQRGSGAYALSNSGVVAGYSFVQGTNFVHAMLNDRGTVRDLGTLGGTQSLARAVNSSGSVVGWAYPPGLAWQRAFLWRDGLMSELGTLGGNTSDASDINEGGIVVGSADDPFARFRPFWWKDGVMHDMGTLGGSNGRALAINSWGDITGTAQIEGDDEYHAFLSKPGSPLYDLGTLGGPASHGHDVNERVHVCGWSMLRDNSPPSRGFLWADGVLKSLGTLGGIYSAAFGLNDQDHVVGASTRDDEVQVAFLWRNDQMLDLNTLLPPGHGWLLTSAYDIDEQGAIVGEGVRPDGATRAYLLTPAVTADAPLTLAPQRLHLVGAMPNPVRGPAEFGFELPAEGRASLELFDLAGRRVRALAQGWFVAGRQSVRWDGLGDRGERLVPGAYIARLETHAGTQVKRFVVLP